MNHTERYVPASDFDELQRKYNKLKEDHRAAMNATRDIQAKSYEEGRDASRRESLRSRSMVGYSDGHASLMLPDNGGAIQFHTITSSRRPLYGGVLTKDADFLLRIWGPPDEGGSYGIHSQGGGNITDFSMSFDLTSTGIVIHRMDTTGLRPQWDRSKT